MKEEVESKEEKGVQPAVHVLRVLDLVRDILSCRRGLIDGEERENENLFWMHERHIEGVEDGPPSHSSGLSDPFLL